ncbi:MAG: hypothetical protein SFW09_03390 [Hyphomicrobiaceae bacterium]|nr:hypothetical protein [Hyphomicrobiaceae bacterium]
MSGTSLVLLAMYSTVNVVGPAGHALPPNHLSSIVGLLLMSAALTAAGIFGMHSSPRRVVPRGPSLPRAKRRLTGPAPRRRH